MRIATYNVHDCIGTDGIYDPARIARVLAELDADIIALQEVTADSAGEVVGQFEAATGLYAVDGSLFERGVGRYGNLLLTRWPPESHQLHDIACADREPRGIIEARVRTDSGSLRLLATHLGLQSRERSTQVGHILQLIGSTPQATVLLGDFNIWGWSRLLKRLITAGFASLPVRSFPTRPYPVLAIDRILVRAPAALSRCWRHTSTLSKTASDHYPVVADLQTGA